MKLRLSLVWIALLAACSAAEVKDPCSPSPCASGVACTAEGSDARCGPCPAGTMGDGRSCADTNGCAANPCATGVTCTDVPAPGTGFTCGACPSGTTGDGTTCAEIDGCSGDPCATGVTCTDVPAPGTGFTCGACPSGTTGDGTTCAEIDGCAGDPCLPGTTCTDVPAPSDGFRCSACTGAACPILRAQAGPDQEITRGSSTLLRGSATGYNGNYRCRWTNDRDASVATVCTTTVSPTADTFYTLTVTDSSSVSASDQVAVRIITLGAEAGADQNILSTRTATLSGSARGTSCGDQSCVSCAWATSDGTPVAATCTATVTPSVTSQYVLTVTDTGSGSTDSDSMTVFVTDRFAGLCSWDVVILTASNYPTAPNPNYICESNGIARRQTVNGKGATVISDLVLTNAQMIGYISVETSSDDDLIGFVWGWQSPIHHYLLNWKRISQNLGGNCGNALAGIGVLKVDAATTAPDSLTFNPSYGFDSSDHIFPCAVGWSNDRTNAALIGANGQFLLSPRDPGAFTGGWVAFTTYRFEFYYTPTRTKIRVYTDDLMTGTTTTLVTELLIADSSYPLGKFGFYSNSQEQVRFAQFLLASLDSYRADAGPDQNITSGGMTSLNGSATLAVPPYLCEWSDGTMTMLSNNCALTVTPATTTHYQLMVTDDFGRVATDEVTVTVTP